MEEIKKQGKQEEIIKLINFLSKSKNIERDVIVKFLLNSIQRIVHSQLDPDAEITLEIVDDKLVLINHNKLVVADDDAEDEIQHDSRVIDIKLSEAKELNSNIKIGDYIAAPILFDDFSRSTYSKIENSFKHEILSWDKRRVYEKYQPLIGSQIEAKLEDDLGLKGATFLLEDGTLCFMPSKYMNKSINLHEKKYHKVTIEEVYESSKSYQVLVSNDSPNKVREILKNEIPEIANGEIQIVGISRVKGERAKISFRKNPSFEGEIDVVGAIIGQNGSRINRVCDQFGEKIDVILYSDNIIEYIANALSPAKIISINKKPSPSSNGFLVVVPDKHNTLAIGKRGINVKLTVDLIRVNIDICSYSYALENNIPINWNGNINEEELKRIDSSSAMGEMQIKQPRKQVQNYQKPQGNFFVDFDEFEKELAEYNSEISLYEPIDYSEFEFSESKAKKLDQTGEVENSSLEANVSQQTQSTLLNEESTKDLVVNKKEINKVNQNFKFDKDIAGDFDIDDYDFSGFDDEEEF